MNERPVLSLVVLLSVTGSSHARSFGNDQTPDAYMPETSQGRRTVHCANPHHPHLPCVISSCLPRSARHSWLRADLVIYKTQLSSRFSSCPSLSPPWLLSNCIVLPHSYQYPHTLLAVRSVQPELVNTFCLTFFHRHLACRSCL
jgi:hypothetical protein